MATTNKHEIQLPSVHLEVSEINRGKASKIVVKPDKESISKTLGRNSPYRNIPALFKPALEKIADYVRIEMIPDVFQREGPGWHPLAKRTVAERIQAGYGGRHPILKRSGDLFKELTDKAHPKHIEIIKTGKYARVEVGGSSDKFIQNQRGQGIPGQRLPSRPMIPGTGGLPLPDRDRIAMEAIIVQTIKERLGR